MQLIPLYVCVGLGGLGAAFYTARLATRNPDVQWNRTGVVSNEDYRSKQYKVGYINNIHVLFNI